jgi:alkylresorcinol/alkylpyrone synthase
MPKIISTGTADAKVKLPQGELKELIYNLFSGSYDEIERMITVFDNANIETRHISVPFEWYNEERSFSERSSKYRETALELSKEAITCCLKNAGAQISDIDNIIFVSSTGVSTPTIDALLFNEMGMGNHIKRTPMWGLGCAGGAAGISRAMEYTKAYHEHNALVIAVELCSLTFLKDDFSKSNIIASSLFSDGAAAVFVAGNESRFYSQKGIVLIDSFSTIYDNSLDVMGWGIVDNGFKVIFSRDIPSIVKDSVKANILEFLKANSLKLEDIKHYIAHPGGMKVINAYEESLNLKNGSLNFSRKVLKEHGNMSSPSVIFVLNEFLNAGSCSTGEYGLLSALGPGFSSELILFKTA